MGLDGGAEGVGSGAVEDAVVVAEAERGHGLDDQGITQVGFQRVTVADDDGALFDGADAENAYLGLDDDRRLEAAAGGAVVGEVKVPSARSSWRS